MHQGSRVTWFPERSSQRIAHLFVAAQHAAHQVATLSINFWDAAFDKIVEPKVLS